MLKMLFKSNDKIWIIENKDKPIKIEFEYKTPLLIQDGLNIYIPIKNFTSNNIELINFNERENENFCS